MQLELHKKYQKDKLPKQEPTKVEMLIHQKRKHASPPIYLPMEQICRH